MAGTFDKFFQHLGFKSKSRVHSITLGQFLDVQPSPLVFQQVPFDHPVYILYS